MRALALVALAACGYPEPHDHCDGPCELFAIDRPIEGFGDPAKLILLEGTFEVGATVVFPGGARVPIDASMRGEHRIPVPVPADATAGALTVEWTDGTMSQPVQFRRPSFDLRMMPFMANDEQGGTARGHYLPDIRTAQAMITITPADTTLPARVYELGGQVAVTGITETIDSAMVNMDGSLGAFVRAPVNMRTKRMGHAAVVVGKHVYIIGGYDGSTLDTVERAPINDDGTIGQPELMGIHLRAARTSFATAIIGNFVYVIGGTSSTGADLGTLERAAIGNGDLGDFEEVSQIGLATPRHGHTVAVWQQKLFVIGGRANGTFNGSVEMTDIYSSGYLGSFGTIGMLGRQRSDHASVVLGSTLYVMGGEDDGGLLQTTEVAQFSKVNNQGEPVIEFTPGMNLSKPRKSMGAVIVGNYCYLIGGTTMAGTTFAWERASIVGSDHIDKFTELPATHLPVANYKTAVVVAGNKLYVLGDGDKTVVVAAIGRDGSLGPFQPAGTMLTSDRFDHVAFVKGDSLYIAGGQSSPTTIERAQISPDGSLSTFTELTMTTLDFRSGSAAVMYGPRIYLLGGTSSPAGTNMESYLFDGEDLGTPDPISSNVLQEQHQDFSAVVVGTTIFAISGWAGAGYGSVASYRFNADGNPVAGQFQTQPNFIDTPRKDHTPLVIGNHLYVIGGNGTIPGSTVSGKIADDGTLGQLAPVPSYDSPLLAGASGVVLGNYIYLIGGYTMQGGQTTVLQSTILP